MNYNQFNLELNNYVEFTNDVNITTNKIQLKDQVISKGDLGIIIDIIEDIINNTKKMVIAVINEKSIIFRKGIAILIDNRDVSLLRKLSETEINFKLDKLNQKIFNKIESILENEHCDCEICKNKEEIEAKNKVDKLLSSLNIPIEEIEEIKEDENIKKDIEPLIKQVEDKIKRKKRSFFAIFKKYIKSVIGL